MTPDEFIAKWSASELRESQASQSHFNDLCRMLGEPTPIEADPTGESYCFERGARKDSGEGGWADVWKRGHFGWEYKGPHANLDAAFRQLRQYALALENPPLLIVCDLQRFRIRTNWTNSVSETHEFGLEDLRDPATRDKLKWALTDPERLRPGETRQDITERAAQRFATLAQSLRDRGHDPQAVAHFVNRLVFCMFAEDVGLLPNNLFTRMLDHAIRRPADFPDLASDLFGAMHVGGRVGFEAVAWFDGGLFDDDSALPLTRAEIETVRNAGALDWSEVDPSILGTLFERGLDPGKRAQMGAHYTDRDKIMLIVEPVIVRPWLAEWQTAKDLIAAELDYAETARQRGSAESQREETRRRDRAERLLQDFLERLRGFTVLDPACGSGNFLYLALQALKDLEHRVLLESAALGLERQFPAIGPANVKGIEINPYAAELARVSVWIGEIQWMLRNGFAESRDPILQPLDTIECRDAILTPDGKEPDWPDADVVIGNPPFLGGKLLRGTLGDEYVEALQRNYGERIHGEADLVCHWFDKAQRLIAGGGLVRAGLVGTNSIRGGRNRPVLDRIIEQGAIFDAWSDEPWVVEGAAVRVSLVCFSRTDDALETSARWDGNPVDHIHADLTARNSGDGVDLTEAKQLPADASVAFMGVTKGGPFDIAGEMAREWLRLPANPNGRRNSDVLKPWVNGMDLAGRPAGKWIVNFGTEMSEDDAALYEEPFSYVAKYVRPVRQRNRAQSAQAFWWRHTRPRPSMWQALGGLSRFILTPRVSKHRLFVWRDARVCPDSAVIAIARDDDTTFGILHSRFHEVWSLRLCTWLGVGNDPRYTPTTTFATFPFPEGLTPDVPAADYADDPRAVAIAEAARRLVELRDRWLNPPEWVEWIDEPVPGYPKRPVPTADADLDQLKRRTLTNLYNQRLQWLANAHANLDAAVAAAYGWPVDISDEDALRELLEMNLQMSRE
ncbi:MAG: class I SAM-dependent DNA methyltransferase [Chloroflexota bacterium]|nr:class I SAM-dependent DNA methyltransferase [Chloroflexota bacterium]